MPRPISDPNYSINNSNLICTAAPGSTIHSTLKQLAYMSWQGNEGLLSRELDWTLAVDRLIYAVNGDYSPYFQALEIARGDLEQEINLRASRAYLARIASGAPPISTPEQREQDWHRGLAELANEIIDAEKQKQLPAIAA